MEYANEIGISVIFVAPDYVSDPFLLAVGGWAVYLCALFTYGSML